MRELLQSLLDSLDAEPLEDLVTADQVLDRTKPLVAVSNAAAGELSRTVRRGENLQAPERDGLTSMASWLRGHLRLSQQDAKRIVHNGRALERLPAVAQACAAGAVTASQVAVIAPVAAVEVQAEAVGLGVDLAAIDEVLADVATTQVHDQLGKVVRRFLDRLDPDGPEPDPTEGRSFWIHRHDDGSMTGGFDLDAVGGEK